MKSQFLKIAGVNSEKEFYQKYPSEDVFFAEHPEAMNFMRKGGEMIKRADGSYSKRGLWDNIRANAGSGKKPTKEMLEQERKIRKQEGGESFEMMQQPQTQQAQPDISAAIAEISKLIMQGEDPASIYGVMLESGIPEDYAKDILDEAMSMLQESDIEEEDVPFDNDEMSEYEEEDNYEEEEEEFDFAEPDEMKRGGSIKINPAKKGTFKAQATKMGMSVREAADYILRHKDEYSPVMVKKANFANNFAKELGGEIYDLEQYKDGGGIPDRYRNMGFSKVGAKKQSTREGKKWMVLAKKGDQYKVVHGGWEGMKDFKQHGSEKRRERFWDRMGGKDSAKAKDPFSPLYWHKRFGTWQQGGETPDMFDYENFKEGDFRTDITTSNTLANLKNTNLNKGLIAANTLGDPRNMMWALPDRGFLGALKGVAGAAAGLSGTALGYQKMFSGKNENTDSYISNYDTNEYGTMEDVLKKRQPQTPMPKPTPVASGPLTGGSGMGSLYLNQQKEDAMLEELGLDTYEWAGVVLPYMVAGGVPRVNSQPEYPTFEEWLAQNATRFDVMQNSANQQMLMDIWKRETGQNLFPAAFTPQANQTATVPASTASTTGTNAGTTTTEPQREFKSWTSTTRGDAAGQIAANNALAGFGMLNTVRSTMNNEREYEDMLRRVGNTDERYNAYNPANPFGNYTPNAGPASNFALVTNTPIQDFGTRMAGAKYGGTAQYTEGGEYYVSDEEVKMILAMGGQIEYLD
jgi:Rps23 Pro-64 3,4-dihydroxylase Tpa1-like proline 4-hydroxylase